MRKRILLVEDDASLRRVMEFHLTEQGYAVTASGDGAAALETFKLEPPDIVITDMSLPGMSGLDLLRAVKRIAPQIPVIIATAFGTIESAVEAMHDGAFTYITKPVSNDELSIVVGKALEFHAMAEENVRLREELRQRYQFDNIVGTSDAMKHLYDIMGRVAGRGTTVLIQGESGTGKELIARAIHYNSPRSGGPFIPINCGAIPRDLVESELFGVKKGAYTGAVQDRPGRFELADKGTIFLDEVADLSQDIQVKLLRVLQDRIVTRLGGQEPIEVDVRVIAATNRSLETAVAEGDFREDIFYRLNVVAIRVPPLRERTEDIPLLVQHFLQKLGQPQCQVAPDVLATFLQYPWPGNVRQLENVIERALVLQRTPGQVSMEDVPPEMLTPSPAPLIAGSGEFPDTGINLEENERRLIQMALAKADGNQTRAAQLLGITRHVLIYRMQKYGLK